MNTKLTFSTYAAHWSQTDQYHPILYINIPFKANQEYDEMWSDQFVKACKNQNIAIRVFSKYRTDHEYMLRIDNPNEFNESMCKSIVSTIKTIASTCDYDANCRNEKLEIIQKWNLNKEDFPRELFEEATASEIIAGTARMMSDPEAQRKWAEEMDAKGYYVSFNGPIPSIGPKEIHISSNNIC